MPASYAEQLDKGAAQPGVKMIKEFVEKGEPMPPTTRFLSLLLPPTALDPLVSRVGGLVTSPEIVNAGIIFLSVKITGHSAVGFLHPQDEVAKTFYALGFIFGGTAARFSSTAVLFKACSINRLIG